MKAIYYDDFAYQLTGSYIKSHALSHLFATANLSSKQIAPTHKSDSAKRRHRWLKG